MKERGRTLVEQKKLINAQNEITCPKCNHIFTMEHDHKNVSEIDTKLRELKGNIQTLEKDIKDLTQEEIDIKIEIEQVGNKT